MRRYSANESPRAKAFRFGSNSLREERYLIALSSKTLRRKRLGIKPVQIKKFILWCDERELNQP